jgi:hypothetical protein
MKNKQKRGVEILTITAFILINFFAASAQPSSQLTKAADSLFRARQYPQSFELYKAILDQHYYSPAILLKMAYVQEGLGHIGRSLYYLNLYYQATNDKQALYKMEDIAEKNNLQGYASTEAARFFFLLRTNSLRITSILGAIMVFLFALIIYYRVRLHQRPYFTAFMLLLVGGILFLHINVSSSISTGIITAPTAYIMSGPSAGASVVSVVGEGHKLEITGKEDVWLKVRWLDKDAYIKQNSLLPLQL